MNSNYKLCAPIYQPPFIGSTPFNVFNQRMTSGFGAHWHSEIEIIYVLPNSKPVTVTVGGNKYTLNQREAIFISCAEIHSIDVDKTEPEILVIEMGFSLLGQDYSFFAGHHFKEPLISFRNLENTKKHLAVIELIFWDILKDNNRFSDVNSVKRLILSSHLFKLAAVLTEKMPMKPISQSFAKQIDAVLSVHSVLTYVEKAYPKSITVEDAAKIAGYEKTRFCQIFKQALGTSFHKYLTQKRLLAAESLLKSTTIPITEIAQMVGIFQPKTFSRLVREAYGVTPTELREKLKEETV